MTAEKPPIPLSPTLTPSALAEQQRRLAREAAALRENLKRRRAQAQARQAADQAPQKPPADKPG